MTLGPFGPVAPNVTRTLAPFRFIFFAEGFIPKARDAFGTSIYTKGR